jgi:hypothetical protein
MTIGTLLPVGRNNSIGYSVISMFLGNLQKVKNTVLPDLSSIVTALIPLNLARASRFIVLPLPIAPVKVLDINILGLKILA